MTAPTTAAKANKTAAKPVNEESQPRIPELLSESSILGDICKKYLEIFDEITKYNKDVLAEKDATWTPAKVIEKARELGNPTDANVKPNADIKSAIDDWENLITQVSQARKKVIELASKELGITLSATAERDPNVEAPLKEKRTVAIEIGKQLSTIASMISDEKSSAAVKDFLAANPMPAVGREQSHSFGESSSATPKYRVRVVITRNGEEVLNEDGFTKASLAMTKLYERGKAPKADTLREAWEKAGNSQKNPYAVPVVEFDDNGLHFKLTKK